MVIGFDVSKATLNWAVVNKSGKLTGQGASVNLRSAIASLLAPLVARHPGLSATVESTGTCHLAVIQACQSERISCRLINPIQTKQFTMSTIRGTKTDKHDARYIALLGLQGAGYIVPPVEPLVAESRAYVRLAHRLQAIHTKLELTRQYLAATGLGLDERALLACQDQIQAAVKGYRTRAAGLLAGHQGVALLRSIPGIGRVTSIGVMVEIGDIDRFRTALQLVAYTGLDPRIRQSGTSSRSGRLTKRGSPYLRHWLFMAANIARRYDPELRLAYERHRTRGKSHTVATVAVSRLLVHRIFAVLKRGTPYVVQSTPAMSEAGHDSSRSVS